MTLRKALMGSLIFLLIWSFCLPLFAEEGKTVSFGVNSTSGGCFTQLNNRGTNNYAKFVHVAPIVNRLRIMNLANSSVVYDAHPTAGTILYIPGGSYAVTGWSSYGTEDRNAITMTFTQTPPEQPAPASTSKDTPASSEVIPSQPAQGGTTIITTDPGYYYYPSQIYNYPNYGIYNNNPPLNNGCNNAGKPCQQLIWCTYCGKYHMQGGCAFTNRPNTILDPYNPYWRGNK